MYLPNALSDNAIYLYAAAGGTRASKPVSRQMKREHVHASVCGSALSLLIVLRGELSTCSMYAGLDGRLRDIQRLANLPNRPSLRYLHPNWLAQTRTKATERAQSLKLALMQSTQLLGIWGRVPNLEVDRFPSIKRLAVKQYLCTGRPLAKDHKSRVDGDPREPGVNT